jgi:hypothetical protein
MVMAAKDVEKFMKAPVFQPMPRSRGESGRYQVTGSIPLLRRRLRFRRQFVNAAFCLWGVRRT